MHGSRIIFLTGLMAAWLAAGAGNTIIAQNSDVSDTFWSIVVPIAQVRDVDMGEVYVTETRDSLVSAFLANPGTIPVRVDSVVVTGDDALDFRVRFDHIPFLLPAGGAAAVTCRFTPGSIGMKNAQIVVYTQSDTMTCFLHGKGLSSDIQVVPDVIDFGEVEVDSDADTTIIGAIRNTGSVPLTIERTLQLGPDRSQFVDVTGAGGFTVAVGESRSMSIRFSPRKPGRTSGRLLLQTAGSESMSVIYLHGDGRMTRGIAAIAKDTIEFGRTVVGSMRDTTILDAVRNIGESPLRIDRIELQGTEAARFSCLNTPLEFTIAPGETAKLDLRFSPVTPGAAKARLLLHHEGIASPAILHLDGIAEAITGTATLGIDTVSGFVGELVRIPILLKGQHDLIESGTSTMSMELRYNASLLWPVGTIPEGRLESGDRIIPLDGIQLDGHQGDTLTVLEFLVTLGNATATPLALEGLSADDGNSVFSACPGYFVLRGLCEEGVARLVDASGTLSLKQNHPNPFNARTAITFEIIERGPTRLLVKDLLGRTVITIVDRRLEPGSYTHSLDASSLSSGSYICILQTPTRQLMRRMEVLK